MRVAAGTLAGLLALALAASAEDARPRFYRWTDAQGVVHYTNDLSLVPEAERHGATISTPAAPARAEPPAPAPPVETAPPAPTPDVEAGAAVAAAIAAPSTRALELDEIAPEDSADVVRLKQLVAEDRERIKVLLAQPNVDGPKLAADPALAEIAERLARHQAELEAVRHEPEPVP